MNWPEAIATIFGIVGVVFFWGFITDNIKINIGRKDED